MRHHYASLLIRAVASVKVVQACVGHASAKPPLDTYAHLFPDEGDRTRAGADEGSSRPRDATTNECRPARMKRDRWDAQGARPNGSGPLRSRSRGWTPLRSTEPQAS